MQSTQGTIDQMLKNKNIPLHVQILNVLECERFDKFILQKCEIHDGIKSLNIYLILNECLSQQEVKDQKPIIEIEDYRLQNGFVVVGKYKEVTCLPYKQSGIKFEEGAQDLMELNKFSDLIKDNCYNIKATLQDQAENLSFDGTKYLILTLNDSLSPKSIKGLIFINVVGMDAYSEFKSLLVNQVEYIFENVRVGLYKNQNRIYFNNTTKIKVIPSSIQWIKFNDIKFQMIGKNCNLVGYIYKIDQLKQISANLKMRKLTIFDMDKNKVKIVVWGQLAEKLDLQEKTTLGFLNLVVKEYQNKIQLQLNYKTRIISNITSYIQIQNFSEQIDSIDKKSNFYKMPVSDLKSIQSEFKQNSDLNFIKYYRITSSIFSIQEVDSIVAGNKNLQLQLILGDELQIDLVVRVSENKFIKRILSLNNDDLKVLEENTQKFDKNKLLKKLRIKFLISLQLDRMSKQKMKQNQYLKWLRLCQMKIRSLMKFKKRLSQIDIFNFKIYINKYFDYLLRN
ncbi:unnamed protein product (macronuclear) [Paramecium tetraurelia]|uniref:Replication protein A OB domain-containing protein n=1 Tax=Paramecium tetraurelia TaxID=5888 RepID=A0CRG5_PARTE|nr:uncharacterized protein GSPATT00009697001 [Paramecium tetraurelia]CAK73382.1 unnamed protein product [Paramecium tetraurelia]|eukprot:XP_001440779.1 hypothetical protein (macronuclear) [Paramecium tetraurelia strain d4-2]